jgi:hypothetical protein
MANILRMEATVWLTKCITRGAFHKRKQHKKEKAITLKTALSTFMTHVQCNVLCWLQRPMPQTHATCATSRRLARGLQSSRQSAQHNEYSS